MEKTWTTINKKFTKICTQETIKSSSMFFFYLNNLRVLNVRLFME